jgi:predicted TIM-barrel fold metal-dependent hydrolase
MESLSVSEVQRYLDLAGEIGKSSPIVDVHVHATEVIFRQIQYHSDPAEPEVLHGGDGAFQPPRITALRFGDPSRAAARFDAATRNRVSRMLFTAAYQHTGHRVLLEHMRLACVDVALLLPVAPPDGGVTDQMTLLAALRGDRGPLAIAYSVPNTVPTDEIARDVAQAVAAYGACAVKLHPNLTGIDLRTASGVERAESILAACGLQALPLLVHGGRSPILEDDRASSHAILANLERVDWSGSAAPVVIAHCGCFGCSPGEIAGQAMPALRRILDRHANVSVDISGLTLPVLIEVLRQLDQHRIVFGSDALYFPMWQAVVSLLHALGIAGYPPAESFALIAGRNPRVLLGLDTAP